MNYFPILMGQQVRNDGCGKLANENRIRSFWQSLMTLAGNRAEPPQLTDITALAQQIRREVAAQHAYLTTRPEDSL